MIKIAVDKVFWTQNVDVGGGEFGKSLVAGGPKQFALWYLGHGLLVERPGQPDRLVPIGNVLTVEANAKLTPEEWSGGLKDRPESPLAKAAAIAYNPLASPEQQTVAAGELLKAATYGDVSAKRGPGRPPKATP